MRGKKPTLLPDDKLQELCNEDFEQIFTKIDEAKRRFVVAIQDDLIKYVEDYETSRKSSKANATQSMNFTTNIDISDPGMDQLDLNQYTTNDQFTNIDQSSGTDPGSITGETLTDHRSSQLTPNESSNEESAIQRTTDNQFSINNLTIDDTDESKPLESINTTGSIQSPTKPISTPSSHSPTKPASTPTPSVQSQIQSPSPSPAPPPPAPRTSPMNSSREEKTAQAIKPRIIPQEDDFDEEEDDFDFGGLV